jgi:ABC-type nitrate/sulfonate/bicarbonate transport system ATPase subunit
MSVVLEGVAQAYGDVLAVTDINLRVETHELVVVIGPSGCGKTTLLHLIAGDHPPTKGRVERPGRTRMIYQEGGLFPWLTARENIEMGLETAGVADGAERERKLTELIELISLEKFEDHYPHQLSGGMRQRVELARALSGSDDVLLMDEPFSALDYQTRLRMRRELAAALEKRPRTTILVTHDIDEAVQLADRVIVLSKRPGTIVAQHRLALPRPRDPADPLLVAATAQLLPELGLS